MSDYLYNTSPEFLHRFVQENRAKEQASDPLDAAACSPMVAAVIADVEMNEFYYKKLEEMFPVPPMNLHQVAIMNNALGHPKDENYRPYCMKNGCTKMPRMYRVEQGFKCWACHNVIGFDLRRIDSENVPALAQPEKQNQPSNT